jgi:ABC-2 type transport system ATP-binding protein
MKAIEVENLRKSYGSTEVLNGINLAVEQGSLLALLGSNGAGKTTTVRILSTLLRFNSGTVKVFGHDLRHEADAVRRRISLTGQFASVDDELTGMENLILIARLLGYSWRNAKTRANQLLHGFGLEAAADRRVKQYSGGMRRRLDIACSIVVAPDLLFLDEPTTGLDPRSRRQIWDIIRAMTARGITVLLTTQYLEEADVLADRIVIIDDGLIIADGTPAELKASTGFTMLRIRIEDAGQRGITEQILSETLAIAAQFHVDGLSLIARVPDTRLVPATISRLSEANIKISEISLGQPSLDDVFLTLTQPKVQENTVDPRML